MASLFVSKSAGIPLSFVFLEQADSGIENTVIKANEMKSLLVNSRLLLHLS